MDRQIPSPPSSSLTWYGHSAASTHNSQLQPNQESHLAHTNEDMYNKNYEDSGLGSSQENSYFPHSGHFTEEWDASRRGSSLIEQPRGVEAANNTYPKADRKSYSYNHNDPRPRPGQSRQVSNMQRTDSVHSFNAGDDLALPVKDDSTTGSNANGSTLPVEQKLASRGNTLKKKASLRNGSGSVKRSSSRRSARAGSVRSLAMHSGSDPDEAHSVFYCPIPTNANPTDVLATRFQTWRKCLKDLIAYYREIQSHYESRAKSLVKLANTSNNISTPPGFLSSSGIDDALKLLRNYNKNAITEANKAKEIEEDVILALTGLRSDLQQKIKEIKNLSGDFKNSVNKEMDATAKAVRIFQDALGKNEVDSATTTGKQDPFLLRMAVDRQVERQIDEENYLHQAYLNLESSGRELESIVVGEIQKAYNAYAGILKREADNAYGVVDDLREGPISMPKDQEWIHFVTHDDQFIDPTIPLRSAEHVHYPGQDHLSAQEIRAGLLERKSKYLKSYTAGWYVLSTTHLHEFKSADKSQAPVMSLYLPEQKLGSHSAEGGSSNKFVLKGRQTGSMHRGHTWVFRAESHDTMIAWYEDIKALTEKSPEERSQFVRSHSRSLSRSSTRRSVSSDGMVDEEDEEPFSAGSQIDITPGSKQDAVTRRTQPGGRFPSDIQVNAQRGLQANRSPSSLSSDPQEPKGEQKHEHFGQEDAEVIAAATSMPGTEVPHDFDDETNHSQNRIAGYGANGQRSMAETPSGAYVAQQEAQQDGVNPYTSEPVQHTEHQSAHNDTHDFAPTIIVAGQQQASDKHKDVSELEKGVGDEPSYTTQKQHQYPTSEQVNGVYLPNGGASSAANEKVAAAGFPKSESAEEAKQATVPSSVDSLATTEVSLVGEPRSERPSGNRTESANTISNLHIPGEYPVGGRSTRA